MSLRAWSAASVALFVVGCTGTSTDPICVAHQPIVGGVTDNADPSVALIFVEDDGGNPWEGCSGSLIAPRVVVTAAHCADSHLADPTKPESAANPRLTRMQVAFTTNFDWTTGQWSGLLELRDVTHFEPHPRWDGGYQTSGYDIALVQLDRYAAETPLPINRQPLTNAVVGSPIRMVGFGLTSSTDTSPTSEKREVSSSVSAFYSTPFPALEVDDPAHNTCRGDSGGPQFLTIDGGEVIAGLTSWGSPDCTGEVATRVDAYLPFIDGFIQQYGANPCVQDGQCDTACGSTDPDCPTCSGGNGCLTGCASHDPDCPYLPTGSACKTNSDCQSNSCTTSGSTKVCTATCNGGDGCVTNCTAHDPDCPYVPNGGACQTDSDCQSTWCPANASARVCVATCDASPTLCASGEQCAFDAASGHLLCQAIPPPKTTTLPEAPTNLGPKAQSGCSVAGNGALSAAWLLLALSFARRRRKAN